MHGSGGVNAANGRAILSSQIGFSAIGFPAAFQTLLQYNNINDGGGTFAGFGPFWSTAAIQNLVVILGPPGPEQTTTAIYTLDPNTVLRFDNDGPGTIFPIDPYTNYGFGFTPDAGVDGKGIYALRSPLGVRWEFDSDGRLLSITTPWGTKTTVTYDDIDCRLLQSVSVQIGTLTAQLDYQWDSSHTYINQIIYSYAGLQLEKISYSLLDYYGVEQYGPTLIQKWTNSATTPVWGTPVLSEYFTYDDSGLLRHIIPPTEYRQMANAGYIGGPGPHEGHPDPDYVERYAETEYEYDGALRIATMWTHGRRYQYTFGYLHNPGTPPTPPSNNAWAAKSTVTYPDGSLRTFYLNWSSQVLLDMWQDAAISPANTWYNRFQNFDEITSRIVIAAEINAIDASTFNESSSTIISLYASQGKVTKYDYDANNNPLRVSLCQGLSGTPQKMEEFTYTSPSMGSNVFAVLTHTVYRSSGPSDTFVTTYAYLWNNYQATQITTTLPVVSTGENGRGVTLTRVVNYDLDGNVISTVDEAGMKTAYTRAWNGSVTQMIQDQGTGKLNLTTDYTLDAWGRTTLELGPKHTVDLAGTPTLIRTAKWTQYLDSAWETRTFKGYQKADGTGSQIVGPVTMTRPNQPQPGFHTVAPQLPVTSSPVVDYADWRSSEVIDAVYASAGIPAATVVFAQNTWVRWTIQLYDTSSEMKEQWSYFLIPNPVSATPTYGTQSVNFGRKFFAYDSRGRQNKTTCAGGTIDKTTYDCLSRVVTEELGTSDANLVVTRKNDYYPPGAPQSVGMLQTVTLPVNTSSTSDRITTYLYDWRNRLKQESTIVERQFSVTPWTLYTTYAYNNLDQVTEIDGYTDNVGVLTSQTSKETRAWDVLGRVYESKVFGVPYAGAGPSIKYLAVETYYDSRGAIARRTSGVDGMFTAMTYDVIGRVLNTYRAANNSAFVPGSDPSSMSNSLVVEQTENTWDPAGNLTEVVKRARFDDMDGTNSAVGNLGTHSTAPYARVSYVVIFPDTIGRTVAVVDYGTYGGLVLTPPTTVPTSGTYLLTKWAYNSAGNQSSRTDPMSQITAWVYDNADRLTTLTENAPGSPAPTTPVSTSAYLYTDDGWLRMLTCTNSATGDQVTEWVYGVTNGGGSDVSSNRLVARKYDPNNLSGTPGSVFDYFGYNRQQQVTAAFYQDGTHHILAYDKKGRVVTDTAVAFGTGVDSAIPVITTGYDDRGMMNRKTSFNSSGSAVNDVVRVFNEFNQLSIEYQEHGGFVNRTTSKKMQYAYADSNNLAIQTGYTYPYGNAIGFDYDDSVSSAMGRWNMVYQADSTGLTLATTAFMGLRTVVGLTYNAASNIGLTYRGSPGDAGDQYRGLDRYGRIVETTWQNAATGTGAVVHSTYGRNQAGSIVWRRDEQAHSLTPAVVDQDSYYTYSGQQQVHTCQRGTVTGGAFSAQVYEETLNYDQTGNWTDYATVSPTLSTTRTHNPGNEISLLTGPTGVIQPVYDTAGRMTTIPAPTDWLTGYTCRWDAWSRLVEVKQGATSLAVYKYDGMHRRILAAGLDVYFDKQWRPVEEWAGASIIRQYLWSPFDRWTLMRRLHSLSGTLDEELWCLKDNLDPVALIDGSGAVIGRARYDAFGNTTIMSPTYGTPTSGPLDWKFLFHGEFMDMETGLYNYGYRSYHTSLGRWLSRDPIEEGGGLNLYAFVGNNSPKWIDFLGLEKKCVVNKLEIVTPNPDDGNQQIDVGDKGKITPQRMGDGGGMAKFQIIAEFGQPDCGCCQVRQELKWSSGAAPNGPGFKDHTADKFQEDRDSTDGRYGHRDKPGQKGDAYYNGDTFKPDQANGSIYNGKDSPTRKGGGKWTFKVKVIDTCNDGKVVKETQFTIDWS